MNLFDYHYFDEEELILYANLPGANMSNIDVSYSTSLDKLTIKTKVMFGKQEREYVKSFYGFAPYDLAKSSIDVKDGIFILKLSKKEEFVSENNIKIKQ